MKKFTLTVFCILAGCIFFLSGIWVYFQKSMDKVDLGEGEYAASYQKHYLMISNDKDTLMWQSIYQSASETAKEADAYVELLSPEQMKKLVEDLKDEYDYVVLDCPAGIEQGFQNAIAGAERAIVVTTPEVSSIRDADRIIGLLERAGIRRNELLINRLRVDMVRRGDMMSIDDVTEILAIDLLGVIPDDEYVVIATNQGEPVVGDESLAGKCYAKVCQRITGEEIPITDFNRQEGFFGKLSSLFHRN